MLQTLQQSPHVSWVGEMGGDYHYGFDLCVGKVTEVADFLDTLARNCGLLVLRKAVAAQLTLHFYGAKYLSSRTADAEHLSYSASCEAVDIDAVDHRILAGLMQHRDASGRSLARALGVPPSTLDDRLKRLEESGIIQGYYFYLEPEKIGMQSFRLLVSVKGFKHAMRDKLAAFAAQHPRIIVMVESLGSWDFEFAVNVEVAREAVEISQELQKTFATYINSVKILPSFGYPKVVEYPFKGPA